MTKRYNAVLFLHFLWAPSVADAHTPIKGIDNFYNGLLHPIFVPAHFLLLIATGLFLGQQGARENHGAVSAFFISTVLGLVAAWFSIGGAMEVPLLGTTAAIGLLIAWNPIVSLRWCSIIGALVGFSIAVDSAQETLVGRAKLLSLLGSGVEIFLLFLYPMGLANYFKEKAWQKIGIRVIGSWISASSLLVLALLFSKRQ